MKLIYVGPLLTGIPNAPKIWTLIDPSSDYHESSLSLKTLVRLGYIDARFLVNEGEFYETQES